MKTLTPLEISKLSTNQSQVNALYLKQDESHLWPIRGKFNVTKRAINRLKKLQREGLQFDDLLSYALAIEMEISEIVNNERNW